MTREPYQRVNHIQFQVLMRNILKSVLQVCLRKVYNSFKDKFLLLFISYLLSLPGFLRLSLFLSHAIKLKIMEREKQTV